VQESRRTRRGRDSKGCFIGFCLLSWIPSQSEQSQCAWPARGGGPLNRATDVIIHEIAGTEQGVAAAGGGPDKPDYHVLNLGTTRAEYWTDPHLPIRLLI
jgi:hypothetical protein